MNIQTWYTEPVFVCPLIIAVILDWLFADPYNLPHPIRGIGTFIGKTEKLLRNHLHGKEFMAGWILVVVVLLISAGVPGVLLWAVYQWNIYMGMMLEGILCYYMLAARSLEKESMKVYTALLENDIDKARCAVSMIVGRDTENLDTKGIIKAAVETVAENTSDGVTAPLLYMGLFGAIGGFFYKAVNTMDSMVGYKNEPYLRFGTCAAKLDDVLNYIPSRLTALFMIVSAYFLGYDGNGAYRIWKRDRRKHSSPNSAQTESVCAGALQIELGGNARYFGKLYEKSTIGDDIRPIQVEDIRRSHRLMYATQVLMLLCILVMRWGIIYTINL